MTESLRTQALAGAVSIGGSGADVVANAEAFLAFLNGADKPATQKETAAKPATTAKASTKAATKPAETKKAESPAADPTAPISAKIKELLKANKRAETMALLEEYGAQSASSVPEDKREAFMAACDEILISG
jgi:hypothetical protein